MVNACRKGKAGERAAAKALRAALGLDASRGQQHAGGDDSPDVRHDLAGVHFEVKRVERLNLAAAVSQAARDAGECVPVVLHRTNRQPWLVTVRLDDLRGLARRVCDKLDEVDEAPASDEGTRRLDDYFNERYR